MFTPDVLDPAVAFLAELADDGPVLEFAIGAGRVAIPLVERGISMTGIELSEPMVDQLHRKRSDIPVVVGDMATSRVPGASTSSTSSGTASATCAPRPSRSSASAMRHATLRPAAGS